MTTIKINGKLGRVPTRRNFNEVFEKIAANVRDCYHEYPYPAKMLYDVEAGAFTWSDSLRDGEPDETFPERYYLVFDVDEYLNGADGFPQSEPTRRAIKAEIYQGLAALVDEEKDFFVAYYRDKISAKRRRSFKVGEARLAVEGFELPTQREFDAASRTFLDMFNAGPKQDEARCYVELVDGKLSCGWGAANDQGIFLKESLDPTEDAVVLSSAYLYSRVYPESTATLRQVRLALANNLAKYDAAKRDEIGRFYVRNYDASKYDNKTLK